MNYQAKTQAIHEAGAKRHPHLWFNANLAAVRAASICRVSASDPATAMLLSEVTLRVLDMVHPTTPVEDAEEKK